MGFSGVGKLGAIQFFILFSVTRMRSTETTGSLMAMQGSGLYCRRSMMFWIKMVEKWNKDGGSPVTSGTAAFLSAADRSCEAGGSTW